MWKATLKQLEYQKLWDDAIDFMIPIVTQEQSLDAYLAMEYLLINLLVEEDHDESKHDYYAALALKYFNESYLIFKENPEYLYYIGRIAAMSEWYFNIEIEDVEHMIYQAALLEPNNDIYTWNKYYSLAEENICDSSVRNYINRILDNNSYIQIALLARGSLGEYILGMMIHWSERLMKQINATC